MKIIAVDDERLALENILSLLRRVAPQAEVMGFTRPAEAFAHLGANKIDVAFLDIEMGKISGLALAKQCKELCPQMNIVFVTGYSEYALEAIRLHASGYLIKPVRERDLLTELENLRHPLPSGSRARVRVQTFGNFEIFVDDKPLRLPRTKCKECLAYLIDRKGARVANGELSSILWDDKPIDRTVQNNTQKVISDLMKALRQADVEQIVIKSRNDLAIDVNMVDCDYYRALSGDVSQLNRFTGEYMSNYGWAEFTLGELVQTQPIARFL